LSPSISLRRQAVPCVERAAAGDENHLPPARGDAAAACRSPSSALAPAIAAVRRERRLRASLPWPPGLQSTGPTLALSCRQPTIGVHLDHSRGALSMSAPAPTIAVVVAAHNRAHLLPRLV